MSEQECTVVPGSRRVMTILCQSGAHQLLGLSNNDEEGYQQIVNMVQGKQLDGGVSRAKPRF